MLFPQGKSGLTTSREVFYYTSMPTFFLYVQSFLWAWFQRLDPCCAQVEVKFAAIPFSLYYHTLRVCQGWGGLWFVLSTQLPPLEALCVTGTWLNVAKRCAEITDFLLLKACA